MRKCPKCGSTNLIMAIAITPQVDFKNNGSNEITFFGDCKCHLECHNCHHSMEDNTLEFNDFKYDKVICTKCGKEFDPTDLNGDGVCIVCKCKEVYPDFTEMESLPQEKLVLMNARLILANKNLKDNTKQAVQKAEEITTEIEQRAAEGEEPKKRRGRPPKKKEEEQTAPEESVIDMDNQDEPESDIEISQEIAPEIPESVSDMSVMMNPPEE